MNYNIPNREFKKLGYKYGVLSRGKCYIKPLGENEYTPRLWCWVSGKVCEFADLYGLTSNVVSHYLNNRDNGDFIHANHGGDYYVCGLFTDTLDIVPLDDFLGGEFNMFNPLTTRIIWFKVEVMENLITELKNIGAL